MGRRELAIDILAPIIAVALFGLLLVLVTGVWPPLVAVESGSMEPNAFRGDLIILTDEVRFGGEHADRNGLVTNIQGADDYRRLGGGGDVIVFAPPGHSEPPILHRVAFSVEAGENWYERADEAYHNAGSCADLNHCPAPHSGYITIGDDNPRYDQADDIAPPVKAEWINGKAQLRVPHAGWPRLVFEERIQPAAGGS